MVVLAVEQCRCKSPSVVCRRVFSVATIGVTGWWQQARNLLRLSGLH